MFQAPNDWEAYYESVFNKCNAYITTGYWEEVDKYRLNGWLNNFETDDEKYFSACLLDSLIYRSRKMVDSSFKHIASSLIPKFLLNNGIEVDGDLDSWMERLKSGSNIPFRFIAIENVDGKSGKSGSIVARYIKESLDLAGHLTPILDKANSIPSSVNTIVFIDDFSGTGEQFCDYYLKKVKPNVNSDLKILYVPLAAHEDAIKNINDNLSGVFINPVELLSKEDSFFHPVEGYFRGDKKNTVESALKFYDDLCAKYGFGKERFLLGKGDQALTYAFHFSTPNNNLKLLYHKKPGSKWINLLNRNY